MKVRDTAIEFQAVSWLEGPVIFAQCCQLSPCWFATTTHCVAPQQAGNAHFLSGLLVQWGTECSLGLTWSAAGDQVLPDALPVSNAEGHDCTTEGKSAQAPTCSTLPCYGGFDTAHCQQRCLWRQLLHLES